ncbi:DUF4256 domain-containing protein [Robertkochia solimangrovi]|uniref:DUF4256 domain-containing protein n=1 Tax=Robertkochia solimangrovi TaxID=2213046 RepID=UPI0018EFBAD4|nr:DUF4256 domain-containing protein [Robertkochia solimangrovi]
MESKSLTKEETTNLLHILEKRFYENTFRHPELSWNEIEVRLLQNPEKLWSLNEMESSGGEPDVTGYEKETNRYIYTDCSRESPSGRRSLCYDRKALESRKAHKPQNSVQDMAATMGIQVLTEKQYFKLQTLETFDLKTSSWLETPESVRSRGGAVFGDRRYNRVFIYHNGADSYYAARGFRGRLEL